jgi:pyridoxine 5-phosphate synthase
MRKLGVNVDHVATLRQARGARYPDPVAAALEAERAGAAQITVHLRGDRRHIQDRDLVRLRESVQTLLNVECATTDEMVGIMADLRPHRVTIVAERPGEVTTEGGYDAVTHAAELAAVAARYAAAGVRVSVFIDPLPAQVEACVAQGIDMVELNTAAWSERGERVELDRLAAATERARTRGLFVAAGHGLNLHNLRPLVEAAPGVEEYNIGHALIGDAVFLGLSGAVARYRALL